MMQRLLGSVLMIVPVLCLAREQTVPPAPVETPWGALISFAIFCIAVAAATIWAAFFKKEAESKTTKD